MNKEFKCPLCGTSDFKVENGYYVCQICGHQTHIDEQPREETKPKTQNKTPLEKSADTLIPLIIYLFLALIAIIPVFQNLKFVRYYRGMRIVLWACKLLYTLAIVCFIGITLRAIKGKLVSSSIKNILFVTYTLSRVASSIVVMIINKRFIYIDLVYEVIYISLVWFTTYKFAKWINK